MTTVRDASTFEQVGGSELANKHLLMELYQRTNTEQPGMAAYESTMYHASRNDLQDISLGEERSLDSAGDCKRIFLAENSVTYQNPSGAKRGSLFPDGIEEPSVIRQ